jgi:hypothetical protein
MRLHGSEARREIASEKLPAKLLDAHGGESTVNVKE